MTPTREAAELIVKNYVCMMPLSGTRDDFKAEATSTIERILTRCVEAENEACAMVADNYANLAHVKGMHVQYDTARFLATAIRARSSDD